MGADSDDQSQVFLLNRMLYLGVEGEVDLPHHTIRVAEDYEQNLRDISQTTVALASFLKISFYVCNPSVTDDSMAPDGCSSLYILIPTPNQRVVWTGRQSIPRCGRKSWAPHQRIRH